MADSERENENKMVYGGQSALHAWRWRDLTPEEQHLQDTTNSPQFVDPDVDMITEDTVSSEPVFIDREWFPDIDGTGKAADTEEGRGLQKTRLLRIFGVSSA